MGQCSKVVLVATDLGSSGLFLAVSLRYRFSRVPFYIVFNLLFEIVYLKYINISVQIQFDFCLDERLSTDRAGGKNNEVLTCNTIFRVRCFNFTSLCNAKGVLLGEMACLQHE